MASRVVSRVFVASTVRDLAKQVQKQLASVKVEELDYTGTQAGDKSEVLKEVEVLLCDGDALIKMLKDDAVPNLKWAHFTWAGVEPLMKALNHQKPKQDFMLTRSAVFSDVMGEYVIGEIIARERDFNGMKLDQEKKEFRNIHFSNFRPLNTLSIGILGYGTIGKRVAEMCKFMGMTVWAVNRVEKTSPSPHVDHFRGVSSLPEVLQNVDYLCNILPSTPDTWDLLSGQVLQHCKNKKTVLINIGRGSIISDESLIHAIREGWLGGAILDVFNQEPLPADSGLWDLPGVTITPHCSGPSFSMPVSECFVENVKQYQAGQPLNNLVDWERGY